MKQPNSTGWYWFLPNEHCKTPTGFLRTDTPVVLLVGVNKMTRDMPPPKLVVRFSNEVQICVEELTGDWEHIQPPKYMKTKAFSRVYKG